MPTVISHAVIHGFDKQQHAAEVHRLTKKGRTLDSANETVISLVSGIASLLGRKRNYQTWGRFDSEDRAGPFRTALFNQSQDSANESDFIAMTHVAMDEIVKKALEKPASTGSHILFSQFREDDGPVRLLVAMIKQKGGIQLDDDFVPIGIVEVDMSKLAHAADIRIQDFINSLAPREEPEEDSVNYLSFLSQTATDEAASYFVTALGCVIGISPKKATSGVLVAIDAFFSKVPELHSQRREAKERVCTYMAEKSAEGAPATLAEIAHVIRALVKPEHAHATENLEEFFNSDDHKLPTEFFVHQSELRKHTKVKIETEEMQLRFNRGMVGTDENSRIVYDRGGRSLKITDLSDAAIAQLDKEITA